MSDEQQEMIEYTIQDVVCNIMEDNGATMQEAMNTFFRSKTFDNLCDVETKLYLDGSDYLYELLKLENSQPRG